MSAKTVEREFTEYPAFTVEYMPNSHRYALIRGQERIPAISVTSALKVIDKPALLGWAERCGVEGALRLERAGSLIYPDGGRVAVEDAISMVRQTGQGADARRDAGGERGNAIHEALRLYNELGDVPKLGDFDPEVRGYVQGLCRWLLASRPEPILVEQVVGSMTHGYAGRFDLLADIDGQKVLVDLKTAARTYVEQHLQIAAYMHALVECHGGEDSEVYADKGLILLVGADGTFAAHDCRADAKDFLAVLACNRAVARVRNALNAARAVEKQAVEAAA
ncbi:MAG TPA: PD-(D/E)XK nuclease family protein [Solirubrobacteraceae bacterium]|jgi:hypothetical protein